MRIILIFVTAESWNGKKNTQNCTAHDRIASADTNAENASTGNTATTTNPEVPIMG